MKDEKKDIDNSYDEGMEYYEDVEEHECKCNPCDCHDEEDDEEIEDENEEDE